MCIFIVSKYTENHDKWNDNDNDDGEETKQENTICQEERQKILRQFQQHQWHNTVLRISQEENQKNGSFVLQSSCSGKLRKNKDAHKKKTKKTVNYTFSHLQKKTFTSKHHYTWVLSMLSY